MASNSILKLQVDDKQYEASLKNAQQGLTALQAALRNSGKSFADVDKQTEQYVRELGKMEATAMTTRGRIGEMSSAFVELSRVEKQLTDQERQSPVGKALSESLAQLKQRTIDAKNELQGLENQIKSVGEVKLPDTGGFLSGDKLSGMLQVMGGNLMTKGVTIAAGAVTSMVDEIGDAVKQGIELAKQGEGIRMAFERLGRGDILDGLREATHGTVTDLELMKAAVKFNDFKLPVEELGTMLAFAQQKAKDTGQSVDYMVDSIVTGLGRKSLMILDNLGLSATEVKEKMKETGDMTKAVGEIIREQMAKAGDYVETAADRAAQANVSLQNKMEELGRKFAPLQEASNNFWTSMKIGILDVIGGPLTNLLNKLTEAGRMMNAYGKMGGSGKVRRMTANLAGASEGNRQSIYQQQQEQFWRYINPREQQIKDIRAWQSGERNEALQKRVGAITDKYGSLDATKIQAEVDAAKKMLSDYQAAAKQILQPIKQEITPVVTTKGGTTKSGTTKTEQTEEQTNSAQIEKLTQEYITATNERRTAIEREIEGLQKRNAEIQKLKDMAHGKQFDAGSIGEVTVTGNRSRQFSKLNEGNISGMLSDIKQQIQTADIGSELYNNLTAKLVDTNTFKTVIETMVKNGIDVADIDASSLWKKIVSGKNIENADWQGIVDKINEKLKEIEIDPITIDFNTGGIVKAGKDTEKSWQAAARAVQSVGSALQQIDDPGAKIMGIIGEAIANIASGFAQASAKEGKGGVWYWIAATAAGLGTMISTISAIHNATGYATGGIVEGNTYSNDQIPIMANAGEVVLNRAQSGVLAAQLEGVSGSGGGTVRTVLSGEQCYLMIDRYARRTGKGEMVFWR